MTEIIAFIANNFREIGAGAISTGLLVWLGQHFVATYTEQTYLPTKMLLQEEEGPKEITTGVLHKVTAVKPHLWGMQVCPGSRKIVGKEVVDGE